MFGDESVHIVTFDLPTDPAGNADYVLFRAPIECTIQRFGVVSNKANTSGAAAALTLINLGTVGTAIKSTGGTIGTTLGGTAAAKRLGANVPASTDSFTNPYIERGEYVALRLVEEGTGWQSGEVLRVQVDVVNAKTVDNEE